MWFRDFWDTFRAITFADLLDIIVMAFLLYFVLLWFKRTKAAFVARGIFIFAMVYVIAQQAGMYLTTWMFQGFFAISLIALVVIFQEELRSFFERLAVFSLRKPRLSHPLQPGEAEILVRMAGHFSRERIGALIVLKGLDPLERHIEGGEDLDGRLSEPLLESLFDPHSQGHDGAVIVDNGRLVRFGVQLPLSKDFRRLAGVGTRHAAALGLSERTDALCLVVSEERGTISLARNGEIFPVEKLEGLEKNIASFFREIAPAKAKGHLWQDALRRHPLEKLIALFISFGLWLVFVQGFSPSSGSYRVPVQLRAVPDQFQVALIRPGKVKVILKGLQRDLKLLNPLTLRVVIDVKEPVEGVHQIMISEENLRIPAELQLVDIDPSVVEVEIAREKPKPFFFFGGFDASKENAPR